MNPLIQPKTITSPLLITLTLLCFGFFPKAQAVVPPPDGGYPGFNTAEGQNALMNLTTGAANTAVGWFSLFGTSSGSFNTAVGAGALDLNTADENTATGAGTLLSNTTGHQNTASGAAALFSNTEGNFNTANGAFALLNNTTGSTNTANGNSALFNNTTGSFNTALGLFAGLNVTTANNVICIGANGANVSNSSFIGHIRGVTTANNNAIPVLIDSAGQLGTISSSRRYKKEIKPMDKTSESILALKPVTFHYKSDNTNRPEFGLIAEEVAEVDPDLVVRDENGEIYTVRYDAVNAMLLNEFLKEHRTVLEQKATIAHLEKGMKTIIARLEEQASQIQKVSARIAAASPSLGGLELSKFATGRIRRGGPAQQVVNNP
jgi:Chaperone of endosialidase